MGLCDEKKCVACGACVNICSRNAITLVYKNNSKYYPKINDSLCIKCGLCEKTCPQKNEIENRNNPIPECYAYQAPDDVRNKSSSGGFFGCLAKHILLSDGRVFGCAYNEFLIPEHIEISRIEDLPRLMKSKYAQSNTGFSFRETKKLLEQGITVLFSGTPCIICGLKNYLGKEYDNLYTVDIMCSGNAPIGIYINYLSELQKNIEIDSIDFRDKSFGWCCGPVAIRYKDGSVVKEKKDPYMQAFIRGYLRTGSCTDCKYAEFPRIGDITIGDFWNIEKYDASFSDGKGTSLVTINSPKGKKLFQIVNTEIKPKLCENVDFLFTKGSNWFTRNRPLKEETSHFYSLVQSKPIIEALSRVNKTKYDVCVCGNWSGYNYGAHLTHYALYRTLTDMGYDVLMLEKPNEAPWPPLQTPSLFRLNPYPKHALSKLYSNIEEMRAVNKICNTFIVGSDQLWNYQLFGHGMEFYALGFSEENSKKISYGVSFGENGLEAPEWELLRMRGFLSRFDAISVRESFGVDICRDTLGIDATQVLDPVFLCDTNIYIELMNNSDIQISEKYIFCYIIHPDQKKIELIKNISEKKSLQIVCVGDALLNLPNTIDISYQNNIKVEDWLKLLYHSELVITDSFHAYCFSILFNKKIYSISVGRNKRVESLSEVLGSPRPMVLSSLSTLEDIDNPNADFSRIKEKLDYEINRSRSWLESSLKMQKLKPENDCLQTALEVSLANSVVINAQKRIINEEKAKYLQLTNKVLELEEIIEKIKQATWFSRKMYGLVICLRDNGLRYTVKHIKDKIKRRKKV